MSLRNEMVAGHLRKGGEAFKHNHVRFFSSWPSCVAFPQALVSLPPGPQALPFAG